LGLPASRSSGATHRHKQETAKVTEMKEGKQMKVRGRERAMVRKKRGQ
jgi:hypothetical protein